MNTEQVRGTTDRRILADHAYKSDAQLKARQRLYDFQEPTYDLPALAIEALGTKPRTVLDLGCGNGTYLRRLRSDLPDSATVGIDAASGMIKDLAPPVVCADAARIPVRDGRVGAVLAMHMLYHLPDVDQALAEIVRVLAPDGVLIASTNAHDDKQELDELWRAAAADVLGTASGPRRVRLSDHFSLDAGADRLREHFAEVTVDELKGRIDVDDSAPVIDHLGSYRTWAAQAGVPFDEVLERARQRVDEVVAAVGKFTITSRQGIIYGRIPK